MTKINSIRQENILSSVLGLMVQAQLLVLLPTSSAVLRKLVALNLIFAFLVILSWFIHKELNRDHLSCRVLESLSSAMSTDKFNFKTPPKPLFPHQP